MQKCIIFIVLAAIFGGLGYGFARFCPIAAPKSVSVKEALALNSANAVLTLREHKFVELGKLLAQMTDADSARKHRPAAEQAYLEIQLLSSRYSMFQSNGGLVPHSNSGDARTELQRIAKSEEIHKELSGSLMPLFHYYEINVARADTPNYSLLTRLQSMRSQIELYKLQHADNPPDFRKYGWKQLTYKTNSAGQISDSSRLPNNAIYGPYILTPPSNPLTKSSEVLVVPAITESFKPTSIYGFVFEESRGRLFAVGADGQIFDESTASADAR
jgi:general secretion pathway protein G